MLKSMVICIKNILNKRYIQLYTIRVFFVLEMRILYVAFVYSLLNMTLAKSISISFMP